MKVSEILDVTRGKLLSGSPSARISASKISTDSRSIKRGEFFVALRGANYNANGFIGDAFKKGAIGAMASDLPIKIPGSKIAIRVEDAQKAFQDIAHYHRSKFRIPVIGVTGSNGKTTTKEMIWKVLSAKYNVLKNEGTKNNHIGVPQTLLKLDRPHRACVLELGMNHRGEIGSLSRMAMPTMAVVTNVGPSHLEFLGDLENVFRAKAEILGALAKGSAVILNGDDRFLSRIKRPKLKIVTFGLGAKNDFKATDISIKRNEMNFRLNGKDEFRLKLLGIHNIYNALAAIAVGCEFGLGRKSMRDRLASYRPSHMRLDVDTVGRVDIINDAYNSNPLSMEFAMNALRSYPARSRWIVSGDMLELGDLARGFHEKLGEKIAGLNIEGLLTLGELSRHTSFGAARYGMSGSRLWHCATHGEAARILKKMARPGDAVLVKGSRGMRMEMVVEKFKEMQDR